MYFSNLAWYIFGFYTFAAHYPLCNDFTFKGHKLNNLDCFLYYLFILLNCHLLPSPWGWHASCQVKSYSKREAKLKKKKKNRKMSHLCPLSCKLCHKRISTLQRLHIAAATHNCGISSRSGVHTLGYTPCTPPHKPPPLTPMLDHSCCLPDIQTSFP